MSSTIKVQIDEDDHTYYVNEDLFGANFIVSKDSFEGTYGANLPNLHVTHIRYPGGEVTEKYFDLLDPDAVPISEAGTFDGLSAYIAYAGQHGLPLHIVVPTKKYADDPQRGVSELGTFIERLEAGQYGDVGEYVIEIGNEYYTKQSDYSSVSFNAYIYGDIAGRFATEIHATSDGRALVAVQAGRREHDNNDIMAGFAATSGGADVDLLVTHSYPWRTESVANHLKIRADLAADWERIGITADLYLSEWNIASSSNTSNLHLRDYGLSQTAGLVEFVEQMAILGYDKAAVWAVQQRNKTSLFTGEGDSQWRFAGYTFEMLSERVGGTHVVTEGLDFIGGLPAVEFTVFDGDDATHIFMSKDAMPNVESIRFLTDDLFAEYETFGVEGLTTDGDPEDQRSNAIYWTEDVAILRPGGPDIEIEFTVAYELQVLDLQKVGTAWGAIDGYTGAVRLEAVTQLDDDIILESFIDSSDEFVWETAERESLEDTVLEASFQFADGVEVTQGENGNLDTKMFADTDDVHQWNTMTVDEDGVVVKFDDGSTAEIWLEQGEASYISLVPSSSEFFYEEFLSIRDAGSDYDVYAMLSTGEFVIAHADGNGDLTSMQIMDRFGHHDWSSLEILFGSNGKPQAKASDFNAHVGVSEIVDDFSALYDRAASSFDLFQAADAFYMI
ncbi:hypothetical protein [Pontivivens ytuae]|uniref:Uncharacterized protein n=1 Tax=Pontivivens ytuae TaxID=2789856 RepID=A0A7S9LTD9_9RHOB|nr:hypothetical protein [Pontivivens ytuae]QPH54939.1 hypothetical protein I0K15_04010 [Pontivivens ytuae]